MVLYMKWEVVALGVVQGLFEWLPVSSKSILMLLSTLLLGYTLQQSYSVAIALQGGTVAAAALYFHRYLMVFRYRGLFHFLVVATAITGAIAAPLYLFINRYLIRELDLGGSALLIGALLLIQIVVRRFIGRDRSRDMESATLYDAVVFGLVQALSVLPGVSRSGITVSALLYLGYSIEDSLKLSFLASIPANIGATAVALIFSGNELSMLDIESFALTLLTSAVIGLVTIGLLIKISSKHGTAIQILMACIAILVGVAYIHTGLK